MTVRHFLTLLLCSLSAVVVNAAERAVPPLPQAFSSFGAVTCDGYVYVYGGHAGKTHNYSHETTIGKLRRLNIADTSKGWEDLAESEHLQGTALVTHGGKVIRVGGMAPRNKPDEPSNNQSVNTVEQFDPKVGKWEKLTELPEARSSHDAVVVGNVLYVFGGWTMNGKEKSTWLEHGLKLDLSKAGGAWEKVPQPFQRRALSMAVVGTKVYVACGLTADASTVKTTDVFETKTGEWTTIAELPGEKMNGFTPATCVVGGKLYISPADGKIYRLDDTTWAEAGTIAAGRWVHRVVPFGDNEMIVLGGASKAGNVAACEVVTLKK